MGLKLDRKLNGLSCSLSNGVLKAYIGDCVILNKELDVPNSITIDRQCNQLVPQDDSVVIFIKNKSFALIMRTDGSGVIVTSDKYRILFVFQYDYKQLISEVKYEVFNCGMFLQNLDISRQCLLVTLEEYNVGFISVFSAPITICVDLNEQAIKDLKDMCIIYDELKGIHLEYSKLSGKLIAEYGDGVRHNIPYIECYNEYAYVKRW